MTASRLDISSASSWSWVTNTNVMPTSRCSEVSSARSECRSLASRAPSGSSRSSTDGSRTSARARATRCCCPPDSWCGRRLAYSVSRTSSSAPATRLARVLLVEVLAPPQAVGDVLLDVEVREERVALEDRVDRALVRRRLRDVDPVDEDLAVGRLLEPGQHAQRRGLAAARGPEQREELARLDLEVDAVDGGDAVELLAQPDDRDRPAGVVELQVRLATCAEV